MKPKPTPLESAINAATCALVRWEAVKPTNEYARRNYEVGEGHAANLRGSLRHPVASIAAIEWLTEEVLFRLEAVNRCNTNGPKNHETQTHH